MITTLHQMLPRSGARNECNSRLRYAILARQLALRAVARSKSSADISHLFFRQARMAVALSTWAALWLRRAAIVFTASAALWMGILSVVLSASAALWWNKITFCGSTFGITICVVISRRSQKQVIGAHTARVVTRVAHQHGLRYRS
ncbi:MAG TPA: hypothetical protein VFT99_10015, partial [Roseiflexaceae bacterium]|nr:hypothetical protein [Roseiflexaceae bacterium]